MSQMESEFIDIDKRNAWNNVYQEIRNESNNYAYIIKDAKKLENKNLNRYRDVNPFDHNRVVLQRSESDYINASLVHVPSAGRSYILTQGPLPATTGHFWLMVWEQKSKGILMLNRIIEKNTVKCHQYWPEGRENGGQDVLILSDVKLKIEYLHQIDASYYVVRKFLLSDLETQTSREILQFHYTTWPDFGVPGSPAAFLNFLFSVRDSGVMNKNCGPPVVHCSAGIGRSGTFCLVDSCLVLIETTHDMDSINIRQQLLQMRHYRMGLIQTPAQLRFSYLAIIEGANRLLYKNNCPNGNFTYDDGNFSQLFGTSYESSLRQEVFINNSNYQSSKLVEIIDNDKLPPPLPPRCIRNSEDLFSSESILSSMQMLQTGQITEINSNLLQHDLEGHSTGRTESFNNAENSVLLENFVPGSNLYQLSEHSTTEGSEIRNRARNEREKRTAALVENIKKKQKESELNVGNQRSFIKISLGLIFMFGFGYFLYKNYSKS